MEWEKKLNLSALINKKTDDLEIKKPEIIVEEKKEVKEVKKEKDIDIEMKEKNEKITIKPISIDIPSEEKKSETPNEENIEEKKDTQIKKQEKEKYGDIISKIDVKSEIEDGKENKWEIFSNYKSDFIWKENKIYESIKKLKNMPKTNFIFLWLIIGITLISISWMFKFFPEKHSIQNYKTSIIDTYNIVIQKEETPWEVSFKNIEWYDISIEYRTNKKWIVEYKYKGITYINEAEIEWIILNNIKIHTEEKRKIKEKEIKTKIINFFKEKLNK